MKSIKMEFAQRWYLQHRRENFAASQRLEGITHPVAKDSTRPLPSKAELIKKYRTTPGPCFRCGTRTAYRPTINADQAHPSCATPGVSAPRPRSPTPRPHSLRSRPTTQQEKSTPP